MKKVTLTREKIEALALAIDRLLQRKDLTKCVKFHYALVRNWKILEDIATATQNSRKDKLEIYFTAVDEIRQKYTEERQKNQAPEKDTTALSADKAQAFKDELKVLNEKHKDDIAEVDALLAEEESLELYTVTLDMVPEEITGKEMFDIDELIIEEEK